MEDSPFPPDLTMSVSATINISQPGVTHSKDVNIPGHMNLVHDIPLDSVSLPEDLQDVAMSLPTQACSIFSGKNLKSVL